MGAEWHELLPDEAFKGHCVGVTLDAPCTDGGIGVGRQRESGPSITCLPNWDAFESEGEE